MGNYCQFKRKPNEEEVLKSSSYDCVPQFTIPPKHISPKLEELQEKYITYFKDNQLLENPDIIIEKIHISSFNKMIQENPKIKSVLELNSPSSDFSNLPSNSNLSPLISISIKPSKDSKDIEYFYGTITPEGKQTGQGILITKNNSVYKGNFQDNTFQGNGMLITSEGDYYNGQWSKGKTSGSGKLILKDGSKYTGNFEDNMKQGFGTEEYIDGSYYKGNFEKNKKSGKGKLEFNEGGSYEGEFENNQIQGKGKYTWPDGRRYEGDFAKNLMHGNGTLIYNDGSKYEGNFENGKKNGKGTFTFKDGRKITSNWINNEPHGKGYLEDDKKKNDVMFRYGKMIFIQH